MVKVAEPLRLTRAQRTTITRLMSEWDKLTTERAQTQERISRTYRDRLDSARAALDKLPPPLDPAPLDVASGKPGTWATWTGRLRPLAIGWRMPRTKLPGY